VTNLPRNPDPTPANPPGQRSAAHDFSGGVGHQFNDSTAYFGPTTVFNSTPGDIRLIRTTLVAPHPCDTPSNAAPLLDALKRTHLIILEAEAGWGHGDLADYLALRVVAGGVTDTDGNPYIYNLAAAAKLDNLRDTLRDPEIDLSGAVVLAIGVDATFTDTQLEGLTRAASAAQCFVIMTIDQDGLNQRANRLSANLRDQFFALSAAHSPYTPADLTARLVHAINAQQDRLQAVGIVTDRSITAATHLHDVDWTIDAVAQYLGSPGRIQAFVNRLAGSEDPAALTHDSLDELKDTRNRLLRWFIGLVPEERYLVLAISLVSSLPNRPLPSETFWAIYEILTQEAWRIRESQLNMIDYLTVQNRLGDYIDVTAQTIGFRKDEDRRALVMIALESYRRALIQALPMLADIVTRSHRPPPTAAGTVSGRLRILDVFGSDLEPRTQNLARQDVLRENLAASIAHIASQEHSTAEHLLLAWAEGGVESDSIEEQLQLAVARTLVWLYQLSPRDENADWHQANYSVDLLYRWFDRYHTARRADFPPNTANQRANVRATVALALSQLSRVIPTADFGQPEDVGDLLTTAPFSQPTAADTRSPFHLLVALAWDSNPVVRFGLANGLLEIAQSHARRRHTEALVNLLSTDWNQTIRMRLAVQLVAHITQDVSGVYLIDRLFDDPSIETIHKIGDDGHYLYAEARAAQKEAEAIPLHLRTATLTLFLLGVQSNAAFPDRNLNVFRVYLKTRLADPKSANFMAFEAILIHFVLHFSDDRGLAALFIELLRDTILETILLDKTPHNQTSAVAQRFERELGRHFRRVRTQTPAFWRPLATHIFRTLFFRPKTNAARATPTMVQLLRDYRIDNTPIGGLLRYYLNSPKPQVQARMLELFEASS